jgi:hypothetical protein
MSTKIIVVRRPSGQISFVGSHALLQKGWEYIELDRALVPKTITHSKLWDWICVNYPDSIATFNEEPKEYSTDLAAVRLRQERRIREARQKKLQLLDAEYFKASERNMTSRLDSIKALKEELRDMSFDMTHLVHPTEILNFWPPVLFKDLAFIPRRYDRLFIFGLIVFMILLMSFWVVLFV